MVIKIRHEAPSQRRSYRISFPIGVIIDGREYKTIDWSTTGVRIGGFTKQVRDGECFAAKISVPFQGYDFSFNANLKVVDLGVNEAEVVAEFINLGEAEHDVLKTFVSGLISGEMEVVDGILRRIDIPVTPVPLTPDRKANPEIAEKKRQRGINFYIAAGSALTLMFLIVLYTNVFQIKVESSIVLAPTDTILAPTVGDVTYVGPAAPSIIKAGEPIIKMTDPRLERDIQLAALKMQEAQEDTKRAQDAYENEAARLGAAKGIVSKEYEAATQTVRSLEMSLQLKKAAVDRSEGLIKNGFISQNRMDQLKSEYLEVEQQLSQANQVQSKLEQTLSSVKKGFQVQDSRVQGGLADLDALKKTSVEQLAIAQAQLDYLEDQRDRLVIKAATDGKLARVFMPINSSVRYGDPIAMFEKQGDKFVQSYLTHEEALSVKIGDSAEVYFPNLWISANFKVKDLDYYSLGVNQNVGKFVWMDDQRFRSVIAVLEPANDAARKKVANIAPGTASTVIFSKLF